MDPMGYTTKTEPPEVFGGLAHHTNLPYTFFPAFHRNVTEGVVPVLWSSPKVINVMGRSSEPRGLAQKKPDRDEVKPTIEE